MREYFSFNFQAFKEVCKGFALVVAYRERGFAKRPKLSQKLNSTADDGSISAQLCGSVGQNVYYLVKRMPVHHVVPRVMRSICVARYRQNRRKQMTVNFGASGLPCRRILMVAITAIKRPNHAPAMLLSPCAAASVRGDILSQELHCLVPSRQRLVDSVVVQ